ncbi:MAG: hypothetical protein KDD42_00060, partial [Bdellovibrionales bacterium]|nr:hypothetical protein [Bdellovibrionales bacterium]
FSALILIAIYRGTSEALRAITKNASIAYLPPELPLAMLFLMLGVMLLLSNSVAALSSYYHGKDLELVLAAPLGPRRFFWGKFLEVFASSSWMALVFALPAIVAFAQTYSAGPEYYLGCLIVLLPYFVIPCAMSILLVSIISRLMPANQTKFIVMLVGLAVFGVIFMLFRVIDPSSSNFGNVNEILRLISTLTFPQSKLLPSYWSAVIVAGLLKEGSKPLLPYITLLYASATLILMLAYLTVRYLHIGGYSRARSSQNRASLHSKLIHSKVVRITPFLDPQYRALISKEYRTFSRDITQAMQLLLLLGLCMIYLYNFRVLHAVQGLPSSTKIYWQGFLVFANVGMGAFVITAVCSRFVFPSISLEGQSYWLLQSAPLDSMNVLRAKFWCWYIPVAFMSSVIFASGALAIQAPLQIVVVNIITSWIICFGVVGLAVGLGALFANFDWENPSQLAASFGSLVFMMASSVLILISLIPVAILIFLRTLRNFGYNISDLQWYTCVGTTTFLLTWLNYSALRWALKAGDNALATRKR